MNKFSSPFYRDAVSTARWQTGRVKVETSDLYMRSSADIFTQAEYICRSLRELVRKHIKHQPEFLSSLSPVKRIDGVPDIISRMYNASEAAQLGPMAAIAGAIAEGTGIACLQDTEEIIIENGGDIWLSVKEPVVISIYAGRSGFGNDVFIKVYPEDTPLGVCTSSGTVGHSISFGKADSVTILSRDASLADAVATAACNMIQSDEDLAVAVDYALSVPEITGALVIKGNKLAAKGKIELYNQ
ncbi:MAG TPA: UPF0280 family protein [Spirochaetota bacterium]|nr:UPF0280 family protein [Spirochaetota bacterium]